MIALMPVIKYNPKKIKEIIHPTPWLFYTICIIFILASIPNILSISSLVSGITQIVVDSNTGLERYLESKSIAEESGRGITNILAIIANSLTYPGILFTFYYFAQNKRNIYLTFGLIVSCSIGLLSFLYIGERGGFFYITVTIIVTYFSLRHLMIEKITKIINYLGLSLLFIFIIPMVSLTVSRFGEGSLLFNSIMGYIGQGNLNFNIYAFDNNGIRYGDRVFSLFKEILGFDNVPRNFVERRLKYPELKINDEVFVTYVGDFVLDFGPTIAFLILTIFSLYAYNHTIIKDGKFPFHRLILIHFVICTCMQGGMSLYSFSGTGGNLSIITYFLLYVIFKFDYDMQNRAKKIT